MRTELTYFKNSKQRRMVGGTGTPEHRQYGQHDLSLLSPIRLVDQDAFGYGPVVLAHTGFQGCRGGNIYSLVSTSLSRSCKEVAIELRCVLGNAPTTPAWEQEKPHYYDMLDQCNHELDRILETFSEKVHGVEGAREAFEQVMRDPEFPVLFLRSSRLKCWYRHDTKTLEDGSKVKTTYADCFSYDGDYADLIADNLTYLGSIPELYMEMPVVFSNDPNEPCFRYFDLEAAKYVKGPYPAWEEFLMRFTDDEADVFRAFVWSIFDAENTSKQCLYMVDQGYTGKTTVINTFYDVIDDLCWPVHQGSLSGPFAFSRIWNRRLITTGSNMNTHLLNRKNIQHLINGDEVTVKHKWEKPFRSRLQCKYLVASNIELTLDDETRDMVIVIHPDDSDEALIARGLVFTNDDGTPQRTAYGAVIPMGDNEWGDRLEEEFWAFLASCYPAYQRLCPTRADICVPKPPVSDIDFQEVFDRICAEDPSSFTTVSDLKRAFKHAVISSGERYTLKTYISFKAFICEHYHLEVSRPSADRRRGYVGICLKSASALDETSLI